MSISCQRLLFIDFRKAYVQGEEKVIKIWQKYGIPEKFVKLVKIALDKIKTDVTIN